MKTYCSRLMREETGKVLIMVLILLVVGGLILTPLLGLMQTGLISGQVYERKTAELYAADAGVEHAIWKLMHDPPAKYPYEYPDPLAVNGKNVAVEIDRDDLDPTPCGTDFRYYIRSTAFAPGGSTKIDAYIKLLVFDLFAGALVSSGDITFHKDCTVTGDVYYVGVVDGDYDHIDGKEIQVSKDAFPTQEENEAFFRQFEDEAREGGIYNDNAGNMEISEDQVLEAIYIPGNLDISKECTITLDGVVYVKGSITASKDLSIKGKGSIVAEGDIDFSKLADYDVDGDTVIMSLYGDITIKKSDPNDELSIEAFIYAPNGTISFDKDMTVIGSVIGEGIDIKKEGSFTYVAKASSFGFPILVPYGAEIITYIIG